MGILYPLLRKNQDIFLHIVAPLIAFFILGWFARCYGHINFAFHLTENKWVCLGLLRAISEICVGCIAYLIYEKIKYILNYKKLFKLLVVIELVSFISVLLLAVYGTRSKTDFLCIILISIGIIISFSGQGINKFLNKIDDKWVSIMSQYSICLYLNHYVWLRTLQNWKMKASFGTEISIYFVLSVLTSALCLLIVRKISIPIQNMINKLKNI